jgi:hypothetical protein
MDSLEAGSLTLEARPNRFMRPASNFQLRVHTTAL